MFRSEKQIKWFEENKQYEVLVTSLLLTWEKLRFTKFLKLVTSVLSCQSKHGVQYVFKYYFKRITSFYLSSPPLNKIFSKQFIYFSS